ncbi:hypothetical protein Ade02nite_58950 [Paractinoplanes deccanensis]|uniref:Uncharacterized protein n=1 Tax=Paractinoplanes deccanensis TaxID=113561 RepID=A0ABQ3YB71_9ACTN|nr:hypothetical protein Ade02nite_58950 [Actinoplanes deccanensis]
MRPVGGRGEAGGLLVGERATAAIGILGGERGKSHLLVSCPFGRGPACGRGRQRTLAHPTGPGKSIYAAPSDPVRVEALAHADRLAVAGRLGATLGALTPDGAG